MGNVLRTVNIASALKTEHYEMVAYQSLIDIARELGNTRAASLLELNVAESRTRRRSWSGRRNSGALSAPTDLKSHAP